jgi:uncharacterized protein (DUF983 family)
MSIEPPPNGVSPKVSSKAVSPWAVGMLCRCPQCGKGNVFSAYLRIADRCPVCGADFSIADAGDGPAVFVVFFAGLLSVPLLFILQFALHVPDLVAISATMIFAIVICLALLPPFKATLFALQWAHKAHEFRPEDIER